MKIRHLALTVLFITLILCGVTGLTASAELTSDDITVNILNGGIALQGEDYEPETIAGKDYYEFDYIDGMALTFKGDFVSTAYQYQSTHVYIGGVLQYNYVIDKAGIYDLVITVNYREGVTNKQVDKEVHLTIDKVDIQIEFDKIEKYYMDGTGGATAHYVNKPASVLNSSLKLAYYEDMALTIPIGTPENAGVYYARAFYEDSSNPNYTAEEVSTFTIRKSTATITATNSQAKYNGEEFDVIELMDAEVDGDLTAREFTFEILDGVDWVEDDIVDAGVYTVRFKFLSSAGNFENAVSDNYTFTVQKANVNFVIDTISFVYSGSAVDIISVLGDKIVLHNSDYDTFITENYGAISVEYFNNLSEPIAAPTVIGEYKFVISSAPTANYDAGQSAQVGFSITRIPIIFEYEGNYDPILHMVNEQYTGDEIAINYIMTDALAELIEQPVIEENIVYSKRILGTTTYEVLAGVPVLPGEYKVDIEITTEHYYGKSQVTLYIEYLDLPVDILVYYGDDIYDSNDIDYKASPIVFVPFVDEIYDIDAFIVEYEGIGETTYSRSATPPQHAGEYAVYISLLDKVYQKELAFSFVILPLTISVKPKDLTVNYGDRVYIVAGTLAYRTEDITVTGLADGDVANSILNYIRILIGDNELTQTDATIVAGVYDLAIGLREDISHPSYIFDTSETATLTVNKRNLFVKMKDAAVNVGSSITITIEEITGYAYTDSTDISIRAAVNWYYQLDEDIFNTRPNAVGVYSIVATGELDNYIINSINGTLIVSSGILEDINELAFSLKGKYAPDQSVQIVYGTISNEIKSAVSDNFAKHQALRVYELRQKAVTADNSKFTVCLDVSEFNRQSDFKVLAKYGNVYTELEFMQNGDVIEILDQILLADMYILCSVTKVNWLWILLIGSISLIILAVGGVILRIYLTGGFKKKHEEKVKAVVAKRAISEDDEFDELLQSFDESTVVKEMTPAERLALKKKEEKYEQYRLKLQRLRSTGDKTLEDSLIKSGVKNIDDDIIIEKMIEEDEERIRRIEEEARLEQEAKEKEKEKPIAVVLPKNTESYEQKSFAPKAKDDEDDFDI